MSANDSYCRLELFNTHKAPFASIDLEHRRHRSDDTQTLPGNDSINHILQLVCGNDRLKDALFSHQRRFKTIFIHLDRLPANVLIVIIHRYFVARTERKSFVERKSSSLQNL